MNNQIFGFIAIGVGIGIGIYFVRALKRQFATQKWIAARGQVLESRIKDNVSSLELYVKYTYVVRGQTYISDRISPSKYVYDKPASEWSLKRMIAPYQVGKPTKVYFNPENPQESVLKKNDSILANIIILAVSLIFIFVGFGLMTQK